MEKGYYSLSTPVWANFGIDKGLPISCFGSYLPDNMGGILYTQSEVGMMSKFGGVHRATLETCDLVAPKLKTMGNLLVRFIL